MISSKLVHNSQDLVFCIRWLIGIERVLCNFVFCVSAGLSEWNGIRVIMTESIISKVNLILIFKVKYTHMLLLFNDYANYGRDSETAT